MLKFSSRKQQQKKKHLEILLVWNFSEIKMKNQKRNCPPEEKCYENNIHNRTYSIQKTNKNDKI